MLTCALVAQEDTNIARAPLGVLTPTVETNLKSELLNPAVIYFILSDLEQLIDCVVSGVIVHESALIYNHHFLT